MVEPTLNSLTLEHPNLACVLEQAARLDAQSARPEFYLGLLLEKQGRKAEAIAELEQAVRMNPDFENAKKDLKRLKS